MGRLLVIEDDRMVGETLCAELRGAGWSVTWARDARRARQHLARNHGVPSCWIWAYRTRRGLDVLRELREGGSSAFPWWC